MKMLLLLALIITPIMAQEPIRKNESPLANPQHEKGAKLNRLAKEASPYLRQHASNPVDWYPWGKEAFAKAKKENKPIFLSIGYSTCHWCHVMARESFEDKKIANFLNKHFVSIKVDREERPDVDKIYMTSYNLMTGESGGWPLNVFLTPDLKMFYGGTYFPPRDRGGRIGFESVIKQLSKAWEEKHDDVVKAADQFVGQMKKAVAARSSADKVVPKSVLDKAAKMMLESADLQGGGWGNRNKFPMPSHLNYLLRSWKRTGDKKLLDFVRLTADKIAQGGIHDHLGGGFHRYSVDNKWLVPHFEKMLYDQAQLLDVYLTLWQITKKAQYKKVAEDIAHYVIRDMQAPEGGYYCAQDAQSEGKEGKYFCWTRRELEKNLDKATLEAVCDHFGISKEGNFYDFSDPDALKNQNVLSLVHGYEVKQPELVARGIKKMRELRAKRVPPMTDKKILASWNGMMIASMARAGAVLGESKFSNSAAKAMQFIRKSMWDEEKNRLVHRYYDRKVSGGAGVEKDASAQAESYLSLLHASRKMYELSLKPEYLEWAIKLADASQELFFDSKNGGFYEAAAVADLVLRLKGDYDGATPTSSSVAVLEFLKLAEITGKPEYKQVAEMTLKAYANELLQYPSSLTQMLSGLDFYYAPKQRVVIATKSPDDAKSLLKAVASIWLPNLTVIGNHGPVDKFNLTLSPVDGKPAAYFCQGKSCKLPVTTPEDLQKLLEGKRKSE